MRPSVLKLYLEDMEVISAEESLLQIDIAAIGAGNMTEEGAEKRVRAWTEVIARRQPVESSPSLPPAPGSMFDRHTADEIGKQLEGSGWRPVPNPHAGQPPNPSNPIS